LGPKDTAGKARQLPDLAPIAAVAGAASGRAKPAGVPETDPELAEVRLIDVKAAAAAGGMSISWWHEAVSQGIAPQPVFRAPRCTRWRAVDVAAFWRDYRPSTDRASEMVDQAAKASAKARERRCAKAAVTAEGR
jgi:predicted DNA-binding transcriptional regulator AlpA